MAAPKLLTHPTSILELKVGSPFSDQICLRLELNAQREILSFHLNTRGCTQLLRLVNQLRAELHGPVADISLPAGDDHASMLLRELLLKVRGEWSYPYTEDEICHCRRISTATVDQAIINGCHTVLEIRQATSANTSCGACRRDIETLIEYRMTGRHK